MFYINLLDKKGNFELIDSELLFLYPSVDTDTLIELTDEQYQEFCERNNGNAKFINGEFVFEEIAVDLTALFTQRKTALLQRIADKTDQFKAQYLQGYSQAEIDSFYRQEREARNELPEMILTEIFEGRDDLESIEELKKKVIEKADLFAIIMGKLFAIKQNFEPHIEQAKTLEDLDKIELEIEQWQKL